MNLAELQREFHHWLVTADESAAQRLGGNVAAGLAVYQNNYRAQLVGCLEQAFPHLRRWIGDEAFLAAAVSHIDRQPPHAWTLDAYPEGFHASLVTLFPHNPDVQELAWIEAALNDAFVAADAEALSLEALATIDWDSARLRLTPSFRSHALTTNAEPIWSALCDEVAPPESEMLAEPGGVIVWRRQFTSRLRPLEQLEYQALLHLQANGSFAALCEWLVERLGETEGIARAGALLAGWLASELIVDIS
ncbi:HvfC/BufC N-terminal domain-containing protein [Pseudomonas gingeri]|uniref:Putative DNA-binding domain-containing protein n=1 Tax=Pseudomonas gingeri TaxID=117681 RepID=A0A7Y7YJK8_9PSED|nr:DNA-binding domain-containing protein [Pseudomonas gingeri]NWB26156.1 putative DNA-binding domain-containing protein [Pseudomonas gingeri]NWC36330.1 putative DNA-binding domain-containing protein [Pseudomonas gingeri]